jgi:hypothetical protein
LNRLEIAETRMVTGLFEYLVIYAVQDAVQDESLAGVGGSRWFKMNLISYMIWLNNNYI